MIYLSENTRTPLILPLIAAFVLIMIVPACENDAGPLIIRPENPETISFSENIQPIFDVHCTGCHDEYHQYLDLSSCCSYDQLWYTGTNAPYIDPDDPETSILYRHLTGDLLLMPLFGPLPDYEIELVLTWIQEGALDN